MANPLARVVMKNVSDIKNTSGLNNSNSRVKTRSSINPNIGENEKKLLSGIINTGSDRKRGLLNSSTMKTIDSLSKKVVSKTSQKQSNGIQTLSSLAKGKTKTSGSSSKLEKTIDSKNGNKRLGSLKTLDLGFNKKPIGHKKESIVGATKTSRVKSGSISIKNLASGESKPSNGKEIDTKTVNRAETRRVGSRSKGKMKLLEQLTGGKKTSNNNNSQERNNQENIVRSNVIAGLEGFVPKVTLSSIGKK